MVKAPIKFIQAIEQIASLYGFNNYDFNEKLLFVKSLTLKDVKFHQILKNRKLVKILSETLNEIQPTEFKKPNFFKSVLFGGKYYFEAFKDQLSKVYMRYDLAENRVLLHYSPIATYSKDWNNLTLVSRGIVIDLDNYSIVVHPYDKFFNYLERPQTQDENLPDLSYESAVKLDGSEGILYPSKDGNSVRIITKGGLFTEQGEFATKLLLEKYKEQTELIIQGKFCEKYTFVFEILYAKEDPNRIVVQYDEPDLKLIGVRDLEAGHTLSYEGVCDFAQVLGLPSTTIEKVTLEEMKELRKDKENFEGWVVRYANELYMKIKCEPYLEAHGARFGTSLKAVFRLINEEKWDDFIASIAPENRHTPDALYKKLMEFATYKTKIIIEAYESIPQIENQKDFAIYVMKNIDKEYQPYMFIIRKSGEVNIFDTTWYKFKKYYDLWKEEQENE